MKARHHLQTKATLHGVRHQVGTEIIRITGKVKMASLQLGHSSVVITERYYCHSEGYLDEMRSAMQAALPAKS
jgi:integrase